MADAPSMVKRVAIGKVVDATFGLIGFFLLPYFMPDAGWLIRWGILLWYTTLGAIVAIFGVFTVHPVLKFPLPWWIRSTFVGAWMNFVLTFFAYETMATMLETTFGRDGLMTSPFWFTLEGAMVGFVIGYFATRFGGEGAETIDK